MTDCPYCRGIRMEPGLIMRITGSSFVNCTSGGAPMAVDRPEILRFGNIAWPDGWTEQERRTWRMMMEIPGAEWEPGR